jgi:hypothetical protein
MNMEAYRIAFDMATNELQGIVSKFEQLRTRKELLEKTVEALGPLVEQTEKEAAATPPATELSPLTMQEKFDLAMAKAAETGVVPNMVTGELTPSQTFIRRDDIYFAEPQT